MPVTAAIFQRDYGIFPGAIHQYRFIQNGARKQYICRDFMLPRYHIPAISQPHSNVSCNALFRQIHPAAQRRTRHQLAVPAFDVGIVVEIDFLPGMAKNPGQRGKIGDR